MTSTKSTTMTVSAIDPARLEAIRREGADEHGHDLGTVVRRAAGREELPNA